MVDPAHRHRATVRDVAEKAGVSISTVSLAFHYPDRVATTTRQRIVAVAAEIGYAPRAQAASQSNARFFILLMEELSLFAFPETVYGTIIRTIEE